MKDYEVWKPTWAQVVPENIVHPHCSEEKAELFEVCDNCSTEYEVLSFIHSCIRVIKPKLIIETGAWEGLGTVALAHACKSNGFGKVHSIENDSQCCVRLQTVLEEQKLLSWAEVFLTNSLSFISESKETYDIGFFDSETSIRPSECKMLLDQDRLKKLAIFHDTSPYRSISGPYLTSAEVQNKYREEVFKLSKHERCTGFYDSQLSRGFIALWFRE